MSTWNSRRPARCALVVAIPLDETEFSDDHARGTAFTREGAHVSPGAADRDPWRRYSTVARLAQDVVRSVESCGVFVARRASLGTIIDALRRFQVVTVVAHCVGPTDVAVPQANVPSGLELHDRLYSASELNALLPSGFQQLDLLLGGAALADQLRANRPSSAVLSDSHPLRLDAALVLYREVIGAMVRHDMVYQDARTSLRRALDRA